uniref:Katanin p80 WD40 repeat-containing subunit B1 homolog isoform X2 n=1 Tax=Rhizophora mucronata TaxID=61149 RepID=A0A2P2L2N4_RHIMU
MGWSTLGDLSINEGKLLGCSFYQNSVGVWVADTKLIEPYGAGFITEESDRTDRKFNIPTSQSLRETGTCVRLASAFRSMSPDYETKEIKNIYVDCAGGKPVSSERSLNSPKVGTPLDSKEMSDPLTEKLSPMLAANTKASAQALNKSFSVPTIVPRNSPGEKEKPNSGTETITFSKTKPGMLLRPSHVRRHSSSKSDVDKLSMSLDSGIFSTMSEKESTVDSKLQNPIVPEYGAQNSFEEKNSNIKSAAEKFEKILSPETPSNQENCDRPVNESKGITSVKIVNGVAVVTGRTRTLVERFERREKVSNEVRAVNMTPPAVTEATRTPAMANNVSSHIASVADRISISSNTTPCVSNEDQAVNMIPPAATEVNRTPAKANNVSPHIAPVADRISISSHVTPSVIPQKDRTPTMAAPRTIPVMNRTTNIVSDTTLCAIPQMNGTSTVAAPRILPVTDTTPSRKSDTNPCGIPEKDRTSTTAAPHTILVRDGTPCMVSDTTPAIPQKDRTSTMATPHTKLVTERTPIIVSNMTPHIITETNGAAARGSSNVVSEMGRVPMNRTNSSMTLHTTREMARSPPVLREDPQISGRELTSSTCRDVTEELMQTHDVFLSTLKSRLTKLQVKFS